MSKVIIALDYPTEIEALDLVNRLGEEADFYKVGLELFTRAGPSVIERLKERGKKVFLDLKLYDIPNTVAGAVRSATDMGVDLLTLHATGGSEMMTAAAEAAEDRVGLLGVTILTSLSFSEVATVWDREFRSLRDEVVRLSRMVKDAGLPGVVSSPMECEVLKRMMGGDFLVVTPGIRLPGGDHHDQSRVATPAAAAAAGADYLVVGRTVTQAPDPVEAIGVIYADLKGST